MSKTSKTRAGEDKILDRRPIPRGYISPGNSPFLKKLPRELRDKIYSYLLIPYLNPEDQKKYDEVKSAPYVPYGEVGRENALAWYEQDLMLMPGGTQNQGSRYIGRNKGVLLASKQIYSEAIEILFGKNEFLILPEWERVWAFWRCDSFGCVPVERPCYVRPEHVAHIKTLYILVDNPGLLNSRSFATAAVNLRSNLRTVVDTFSSLNLRLRTLKIRYRSCFEGEVETMRQDLEGTRDSSLPDRPIMMKNNAGRYDLFRRHEAEQKLFRLPKEILEPLKGLGKIAESVKVCGDLSTETITTLEKALAVMPTAVENPPPQSNPSSDLASLAQSLLRKNPNASPQDRALYEQLMRVPAKSPSVMADLCAPLRMPRRTGGIGFIGGKPVFGPPRP